MTVFFKKEEYCLSGAGTAFRSDPTNAVLRNFVAPRNRTQVQQSNAGPKTAATQRKDASATAKTTAKSGGDAVESDRESHGESHGEKPQRKPR